MRGCFLPFALPADLDAINLGESLGFLVGLVRFSKFWGDAKSHGETR